MQPKGRISAFVCVFIIARLPSDARTSSQVPPDIRKFCTTKDPIWSYMTTSNRSGYDCKVDVMDNIDSEYVHFRRFLSHRKLIVNDWVQFLEGHFYYKRGSAGTNIQTYNAMNVTLREHGALSDIETLVYQSIDNMCGIFVVDNMVNGAEGPTFELRVKNSSIHAVNATECSRKYLEMVKKQAIAKVTYQPACQDILKGMNNIVAGGSTDNGGIGLGGLHHSEPFFIPPAVLLLNPLRVAAMFLPSWLT
uniref:Lipocalin n=1 Tax=Rhipicephalus zambeziensis TaxID=60191 RepID=A0A224YBE5_9ACAR